MKNELKKTQCPKCGKMTLEIQGKGTTKSGRPYQIEDCSNCDYSPINIFIE